MSRTRAIRRLKESGKKKAPVLTPREFKRLLYVAGETRNPERNTLIVWLLFGAAFRITEVAVIEIKDVLWKSGKLRNKVIIPAKYCKNGLAGHVFFYHKRLLKALDAYLDLRVEKSLLTVDSPGYRGLKKDSKVILSDHRRPYSLKRKLRKRADGTTAESWACDTLQDAVTKWGREAGIKGFTTHSGRRTLATRAANRGSTEDELCVLLRHTSDNMPYEYIDSDLPGIIKTLEELYALPDDEENTKEDS
jgi:integrase/recombinase XerD